MSGGTAAPDPPMHVKQGHERVTCLLNTAVEGD